MATLPRTTKLKSPRVGDDTQSPFALFQVARAASDFDAGLNTSAAWTEHLALSDDEPDDDIEEETAGRPARALYTFEGKVEFRELSVEAGDDLVVVREDMADGWSLVKNSAGELGLLPRTYYAFTTDLIPAPGLDVAVRLGRSKEASDNSVTPRGSPTQASNSLPIIPQNTGEWKSVFPSFRRSLLGGKSLYRFSSFVTSGAEEWVLKGAADAEADILASSGHNKESSEGEESAADEFTFSGRRISEADMHFVEVGPSWKSKVPPFQVLVHSPSKRISTFSGAYTVYNITSLFQAPLAEEQAAEYEPSSVTRVTVQRRFSHFVILHTALSRRLPGIALPPLPEKQYAGRFSKDFVEARRGDLERYLGKLVRHPVARYAEIIPFFLGCEDDDEWKRQLPYHLSLPPAGPSFYAHVYHPAFNVDVDEAAEAVDRFSTHIQSVTKGVQNLRKTFGRVREARIEMSKADRLLSYSLLSLITSKPLASAPTSGKDTEDESDAAKQRGCMNEQGAWCWREGCEDCLKFTKAIQRTADMFQSVADSYDNHARGAQLSTHEALKIVAHPSSMYDPVISTHSGTLSHYREVTRLGSANEEIAARCETVLNTTMAEMETYHSQKQEDFRMLVVDHLDGEIAFYEQVVLEIVTKLRNARQAFDGPLYDEGATSPRQPSMYERELENPRLSPIPLPQPCPHVYDSTPMRPVSMAIQGGVGMILGSPRAEGRSSVFSKFW